MLLTTKEICLYKSQSN